MIQEDKVNQIVEKIISKFKPQKVILFGSYAWGKPGPDSDLDLLVIKDIKKPRLELERELRGLLFPSGIPLDVLVYTPDELEKSINEHRNFFLEDIVHNGRPLFTKQGFKINTIHKQAEAIL